MSSQGTNHSLLPTGYQASKLADVDDQPQPVYTLESLFCLLNPHRHNQCFLLAD